jgi:hypothetical protein
MNAHENDYDDGPEDARDEHDHDHDHENENDVEEAIEEALELDTQSQIFLEMRRQNLDLLRVAAEVAGFTGQHPALKPNDMRGALKAIWDIYSEFYAWIDPEESDDDEDEEDDEP